MAAALTGDGECKWYAQQYRKHLPEADGEDSGQIPQCAFWAVGLEAARTYADASARNPNHISVLMGQTGYAAMRNGEGPMPSTWPSPPPPAGTS